MAWCTYPLVAKYGVRPLRQHQGQADRVGEAVEVQPALAWLETEEKCYTEALWSDFDFNREGATGQEALSGHDGSAGDLVTLDLAQPHIPYVYHSGTSIICSSDLHACTRTVS